MVLEAVDQKDWCSNAFHGTFWRGVSEVDAVTEPSVEKRQLDGRAQDDTPQPRAGTKKVANPHISDPSESGK